ncbi:MAG: nickel-dependent hydrogenase large subunit [Nocardioidaceae bacterium]
MSAPTPLPEPREVTAATLRAEAGALLDRGARLALAAGHHDGGGVRIVHTFLVPGEQPHELAITVPDDADGVPTMADLSYAAGRFEREVRDLYGVTPLGHPLARRLVRHGHWPSGYYPMRRDATPDPTFEADTGSFPFVEVGGDGVYEIPVGPVHAGLIEPGHFRFSVVGETIVRMKARLWFVHRGVEKLFEGRAPEAGIELAERISGDTAVGHSLAYVMAVEQALGVPVGDVDTALRALLLEMERLHNHVADLGAIVNDVGYGIVNAHAQALRERLLRHHRAVTGHRLLRGAIGIGSTQLRQLPDLELVASVAAELAEIVAIALGNHVVVDRLTATSVLPHEQAHAMGTLGYVARASGVDVDARRDHPFHDLGPEFQPVMETTGDVMARFLVRAREAQQSADLIAELTGVVMGRGVTASAAGGATVGSPVELPVAGSGAGLGVVEAWRGTLVHRVEIRDGLVTRCKVVDPSFFNWPALPVALKDTIVPDFPLTNKSFNQSYAGNDL